MSGKVNILFTRSKLAAKRMCSLVLTVFVLQVIAAGFCVSTASASTVEQVLSAKHGASHMSANMDEQAACAHCDLPNANVVLDKHTTSMNTIHFVLFVAAVVPSLSEIEVASYLDSPPDLNALKTSLFSFDLNQRIRV